MEAKIRPIRPKTLARVLAILALALTALPLSGGAASAAAADSSSAGTNAETGSHDQRRHRAFPKGPFRSMLLHGHTP